MKNDNKLYYLACIALLIVAAGSRFHELSENSLRYDEAATANCSRNDSFLAVIRCNRRHSSPVLYPLVLWGVQKVESSPFSVRLVPAAASTGTVFVLLFLLLRVGVRRSAAFLAALMATLSSAAIDHAQDVREYSIDALIVALLIVGVLAYLRDRKQVLLCTALFLSPLVQYGLVLFSIAVLGTLVFNRTKDGLPPLARCKALVWPVAFFAAGCVITYAVTLQYQWGTGFGAYYLSQYYYAPEQGSMLAFALSRTEWLLAYHLPDGVVMPLIVAFVAALAVGFWRGFRHGAIPLLFALSLVIAIFAALLRYYPLGDIRQCIYLGPIIFLAFGHALHSVADLLPAWGRRGCLALAVSVIALTAVDAIKTDKPYRETYDVKGVIAALENRVREGDKVYISRFSLELMGFYLRQRPANYHYGGCDPTSTLESCTTDVFRVARSSRTDRVWFVRLHSGLLDMKKLEEFNDGIRVEHVIAEPRANLHLIQNLSQVADLIVDKREGQLIIDSKFKVYLDEHALTYVRQPCKPADTQGRFLLSIIPADILPDEYRRRGFSFDQHGVLSDGKCVATVPLPDYAIAGIFTGQRLRYGHKLWSGHASLARLNLFADPMVDEE